MGGWQPRSKPRLKQGGYQHDRNAQLHRRPTQRCRKEGRGRRIVIAPLEPDGEPLCIDTSLRTVAYLNKANHNSIRLATSATIPLKTSEAINHYFIDYLERVARKLK